MIERLLLGYSDDDFIQKTRATYLVWFLLIALPVMTLLAVALYAINRDAKSLATIPGVGIGWLFAVLVLYFIRSGRYARASYIFAIVFNLVVAVLTVNEYHAMPALALSGIGWFSLVCVVSTVLFCPTRVVIASAALHVAARTYTFASLAMSGTADMNAISTNYGDGVAVIILVTILAILIVKMLTRSSDKIGTLLETQKEENRFLIDVIATMTRSSASLKEEVDRMTVMANKFSDNVLTQATSTEQASAAMEELASSSHGIAEKSELQRTTLEKAYARIQDFSSSVSETGSLMEKAIAARKSANELITTMKTLMDKSMKDMEKATGSADSMMSFTDVIKGISDNISLLSLNAAIEAARAGETGRGFAVVADEVGRLSEQTIEQTDFITRHANELGAVIRDAGSSLAEAIRSMAQVIGHVETFGQHVGVVANRAGQIVETNRIIQEEILAIKNNSEEITVATKEQRNAAVEVSTTIERINEATQHISLATEELLNDARQLSQLAKELTETAKDSASRGENLR